MLISQDAPVATTAVLLERRRLQQLWDGVRREDGTFDELALRRFEKALAGPEDPRA